MFISCQPNISDFLHHKDGIVLFQWRILFNNASAQSIAGGQVEEDPIPKWTTVPQINDANNSMIVAETVGFTF